MSPPASSRAVVVGRLRAWLCRKNPAVSPEALAGDLDLIDAGVLDSLALVEFILFIEQECGRTILREGLDPRPLRTLDGIYQAFFEAQV
jgi:acyl carrier protein